MAMVWAACRNPRARSVNFSMSMLCPSYVGDGLYPHPSSGNGIVTLWQENWVQADCGTRGIADAHRIPVSLPGKGSDGRGAGGRGGGGGGLHPLGPRLCPGAG